MPENDLATELADWKRSCSGLDNWPLEGYSEEYKAHKFCAFCDGMGKVYWFDDSVRVFCRARHYNPRTLHDGTCAEVGCRGWTASIDLAVWEQAIFKVWNQAHISKRLGVAGILMSLEDSTDESDWAFGRGEPMPALLEALSQVLEKEEA